MEKYLFIPICYDTWLYVCRLKAKYKPIIEEKYGRPVNVFVPIEKPKNYKATGRYYEAEI